MYIDATLVALVALGLFFLAIWRAGAFNQIGAMLDARADKIKTELAKAEALRAEAQALQVEYATKLRAAEVEAVRIVEQAEKDAEALRIKAEADMSAAIERRTKDAEDRINRAETQAYADIRATASDAAIQIARSALSEQLAPAKRTDLMDSAIAEVAAKFG